MNEQIEIETKEDPYKKYNDILKEIKEVEMDDDKYSVVTGPKLPLGGDHRLTQGRSVFTGFNKEIGVAEFCYGKQKSTDIHKNDYRYLTQEKFDEMIEKHKLAYKELKRINAENKPS